MALDQDLVSDDARRTCPKCGLRMSSLAYNKLSFCSNFSGQECTSNDKYIECSSWLYDDFAKIC